MGPEHVRVPQMVLGERVAEVFQFLQDRILTLSHSSRELEALDFRLEA
jgi:hypothetical protein